MSEYWPHIASIIGAADLMAIFVAIPVVLYTKKEPMSAVSWCLIVLLLPLAGSLLFWVFGYTHVYRPIKRKREHREAFDARHPPRTQEATRGDPTGPSGPAESADVGRLALAADSFPVSTGNAVTLYHDTADAFAAMLAAIRGAAHHVHLEFYIIRDDGMGRELLGLLAEKARAGVQVRFLFDSVGGLFLPRRAVRALTQAGGRFEPFLPLNIFRSRLRVNMRNHRKILVVDGRVGFTGGMNIGDEYLGRSPRFGYWRDSVVRVEGPAVNGLQRVFAEDWDFAVDEPLTGAEFFPPPHKAGPSAVQVVGSGPDQFINSIRDIYFGAIALARERVWITTPYFVPDNGILDALRLARYRGADVRLLMPATADHFLTFHAGHFYWDEVLPWGVKVYRYTRGFLHAKVVIVDERSAMVGTANLDNRSLRLNFEVGCLLHDTDLVRELAVAFENDLKVSERVDPAEFARRSLATRLTENACRLLSPIL
jgi:cardiolipin synthase A/B